MEHPPRTGRIGLCCLVASHRPTSGSYAEPDDEDAVRIVCTLNIDFRRVLACIYSTCNHILCIPAVFNTWRFRATTNEKKEKSKRQQFISTTVPIPPSLVPPNCLKFSRVPKVVHTVRIHIATRSRFLIPSSEIRSTRPSFLLSRSCCCVDLRFFQGLMTGRVTLMWLNRKVSLPCLLFTQRTLTRKH